MADSDLFMKITGDKQGEIKGESKKTGKEDQTELTNFSISANQPGSYGAHSGGGSGKVSFSDISFSSTINKQTPLLFMAMKNHEHLTEVIFTARKGVGDSQQDFYIIKLTDAVLTEYSVQAHGGGPPSVNGRVNYKQIEIIYKEQLPDQTLGEDIIATFDQSLGA